MMGFPPSPSSAPMSSHLYSQKLQLKLYQALIFSVPALFSIILFLLFYFFYLKGRRNSEFMASQIPSTLPLSSSNFNQPIAPLVSLVDLKEELKEKLHIIMFDEDLKAKDSQCCVCLGEFEIREQLHQILECKHVFHVECIHNWLRANTTCPLCRTSIIVPITRNKLNSELAAASTIPRLMTISRSVESIDEQPENNSDEHVTINVIVNVVNLIHQ